MASVGAISFDVRGDAATAAKLDALPLAIQKKVLRQALRPAAKMIRDAAAASIHGVTGRAAESLKVRAAKRSRRFPNRVSILVQTAAGWFKGPTFYYSFAEMGHRLGSRKLGTKRRMIAGKHWLERAVASQRAAGQALVTRLIAEGIEREAKLLGR